MDLKKSTLRLASTLLAAVMLTQCVPMNAFAKNGKELEKPELEPIEGYAVQAPREGNNTIFADIPPTFSEGSQNSYNETVEWLDKAEGNAAECTDEVASSTRSGQNADFGDPHVSAPYIYKQNQTEQISLNTGAVGYESIDCVLPGINGLDLVIGRRYNSQESNVYNPQTGFSPVDGHAVTEKRKNDYELNLYGLGHGWSFLFSSIERDKILHLADGRSFPIIEWTQDRRAILSDRRNSGWMFENKNLDIVLLKLSNEDYAYELIYKDGKKEYFTEDGVIAKTEDRFGNAILYEYSKENGYPHYTITDTLGRTTVISGMIIAGGHVMTVALPDNTTLQYTVRYHQCISDQAKACALASYRDAAGETTHYSYSVDEAIFNVGDDNNSASTNYINLVTITHPTNAQTVYTYQKKCRTIGEGCWTQIYKVSSRKDVIGNIACNERTYAYSAIDCSGYPKYKYPKYAPNFTYDTTVTDSEGQSLTATFNSKHKMLCSETHVDQALWERTEYEYDGNGYPIRTETTTYDGANIRTTVTLAEYDELGNILVEWSSLAEGDSEQDLHKISYLFDAKDNRYFDLETGQYFPGLINYVDQAAYNLITSQIYHPDENTAVRIQRDLTADHRNVAEEKIYVNDILKRRTTYTYDAYGNVLTSRQYNSGGEDVLTQYTYQDNAYLASRSVSNGTGAPITEFFCTYDLMGRLISSIDANGNTSTYSYDALGNVTQVTNPDLSTVLYDRNYTGNYVTVTNELGDAVKYTYTPLGLEYETVDVSTGRVLQRKEYDSRSRLETVSDFVYGAVTTYTYDTLDRVTSVTVEDGDHTILSRESYVYDDAAENGRYQKITKTVSGDADAPDLVTTEYKDKKGRTVKTGRFLNGTEYFDVFTYDTTDQILTALTAADAATGLLYSEKYEYDGLGQPVRIYNGEGQYVEAQYDMLGRKTAAWDYSGTPTLFEYDVQGRLTRQTVTVSAGQTAVSEYEYDNAGNLILERTPANDISGWNEVAYTYDSRNRLISATQYDGSAAAAVTTYTYDAAGNLLTMTAGGHTTAYTYDRFANLLSMTDPLGQSETYSYSALGKLESKTDRNNVTTSFAYDAAGRIVSLQAGTGIDADVVNYAYTATGQIARMENNWQITEYEYDGFGRVVAVYEGDKSGILATSVQIDLDASGGTGVPTQILRAVGEAYALPLPTRYGHVFDGWYLEETLIESDDLVTTSQRHTLTAHWITLEDTVTLDACGGTVSPTVVMSQYGVPLELPTPVWTGHDFLGWYLGDLLVEDGDPSPITEDCTLYAYWSDTYRVILDLDDGSTPQRIIVETDNAVLTLPTPTRTGYTFDGWYEGETLVSMGGEIQITDDLTLTAHWTPNTYTVKYRGQFNLHPSLPDVTYSTQFCTYDVPFTMPGRPQNPFVAGKTFAGWSYTRGASTPDFLPEQEDVVNLTDEDGGVVELWDVWRSSWPGGGGWFGMRSSAADPEPAVAFHTKTYTYDLAGNRTYFELSKDGETIQSVGYAYDTLNRLTAVTENGVTQASYTYDVNGNRSALTLANGVTTAYTYNAANWITSLTNSQNGTTLSSFDYTYYPSGNQASKTDQNGVVTTYEYDGLGRLTRESEQGGLTVSYAFDAAGNRSGMAVTGTENYTVNYNYDANNRLISSLYTGSTTQSSYYTYDACGNLLTAAEWRPQEALASAANYGYNGFNQLVAQTVNNVTSSFAYNADGIRTAKLTGNVLTGYLLDGGNVAAELEDDALSASYLRGANLISRTTSATEYYTFNAHGDVVGLVNNAGTQTKTYDYDAFGNEKDRVGADPNPFRYCGEYFDVESGSYYLRARYYDPSIGRFTQEDPAKDGLNWYSYTGGNPVLFIDPTGLTMIALRTTIEEMGGVVEWDDSSKTATVYLDGKSVQVYAGDDNGSYIGSDGKMYTDDNGLFMALGTVVELGKGWIARIERDLSGAHGLRHIHLQKEDKYFAQIETGKPSHYNKWSDPGGPPNSVKKKLKKELDWDWDAKEKDWASKIKIEFYDLNVCRIEYPDGRTVIIRNSRWSFGIITMQDLRRYSDSTGPTYVDLCEGNEMAIPVVPMPNYVPIPVPVYYPAPVFAVP